MKVVILGAGSTIGTFNGASLGVDRFVDRLYYVRGVSWRDEYRGLCRVIGDCKSPPGKTPSLDRVWTRIDYYSKLDRSLGTTPGDASLDFHKALLDAYSLTADERAALAEADAEFTLKTILRPLDSGDALISFNWDTAAERVAKTLNLDLASAHESRIRLIKPHGSLSWRHCAAKPGSQECAVHWSDNGAPLLEPMNPCDVVPHDGGQNAHFCEPLVLGAVPIKSELLREVQREHAGVYERVADQWAEVVRAITHASELVVAGYGFPPEDGYGHFLLREAAGRRGRTPLSIVYYSLPIDRAKVEASMRDIFGDDVNYRFAGCVKSLPG